MADPENKEVELQLDDLEVVEQVVIDNPEVVKRVRELKEQGIEGVYVKIGTN